MHGVRGSSPLSPTTTWYPAVAAGCAPPTPRTGGGEPRISAGRAPREKIEQRVLSGTRFFMPGAHASGSLKENEALSVAETLERLRTLQNLDEGIRALDTELEQLPVRLERAREDLAAIESKHKTADQALEGVRKVRRDLEQQIADTDQSVIKFENDKIKVKTNEEFRALNIQIDQVKKKKSDLEDQVLLNYDEEETAAENARRLKEELDAVAKTVAGQEAEIKARAEDDKKRLGELREQREALVAQIEAPILNRYRTIQERKGGAAVVFVVRGACGGCHTAQPPQKVNEIRKENAILNCDFCGRFLLWNNEGAPAS